jgi:general secretion pathway protein A
MYNEFFGLREEPFNLAPNPKFLFLSQQHREALAGLSYSILHRKHVISLTGEIGTGKTTLVAAMIQCVPADRAQFSVIANPTLTSAEVVEATLLGFGITEVPGSKPLRLHKLNQFIQQGDQDGIVSVLVIDEAQKLTSGALEEVRLLGNLESLQILLVGQSELADLFRREELRAFKQRVALRLQIGRLTPGDVEQYIRYRWHKAGGGPASAFSPEAVDAVARWSGGVPRLINAICDNALMKAFQQKNPSVALEHVADAVRELDIEAPATGDQAEPSSPASEVVGAGGEEPVPEPPKLKRIGGFLSNSRVLIEGVRRRFAGKANNYAISLAAGASAVACSSGPLRKQRSDDGLDLYE